MWTLSVEARDRLRILFGGKVFLVGGGPGDWGLFTLRGATLLSAAEVVVYDHLLDPRILELAPDDAELIYAGKQAGKHALAQDEINGLLVERARAGKMVVRLKGGDPWIFGRGAEEAEFLSDSGVPFEIVPGVSALTAALSAAGIPLTHREFASAFTAATGHEDPTKSQRQLDYSLFSELPGSFVVFMGVRNLGSICEELMAGGRDGDESAALVRKGYTPRQKVLDSPLSSLADRAASEGIVPPALFIVSPTVELRQRLEWFEKRPLWGLRIVVTRPREQAAELVMFLELLGAEVLSMPAIAVDPPETYDELDREIENLPSYKLLVFTSVNGVGYFMGRLFELGFDARRLAGIEVAAVGEATANELKRFGIACEHVPRRFTSASLAEHLSCFGQRGRALLVRSPLAPPELESAMVEAGFEIARLETYGVRQVVLSSEALDDLAGGVDWLTFASASAAKGFFAGIPPELEGALRGRSKILSIGPETSKAVRSLGWDVDCEASVHTSWGMVQALLEYIGSEP